MSGLSRLVIIRLGDIKLRFFPTKFSADLWFPSKNILADCNLPFLKKGGTVIDVGSNIGLTVLLFKKYIGSEGAIYAFEPDPKIFQYLKENIRLNNLKNVFLFNHAVGEKREKAFLKLDGKSDTGNVITFSKENSVPVDMACLDDLLKDYSIDKVDLLKVDTEGFEKFVFLGGKEILKKTSVVVFEAIPENCARFHYEVKDPIDYLEKMNFYVFSCTVDSNIFERIDVTKYICSNNKYLYDLFAVKDPSLINNVKWL